MPKTQNIDVNIQTEICIKALSSKWGLELKEIHALITRLDEEVISELKEILFSESHIKQREQKILLNSLIKQEDVFRVIILPTTIIELYMQRSLFKSVLYVQWKRSILNFMIMWISITILDKSIDLEAVHPVAIKLINQANDRLPWELKAHMEVIIESYKKKLPLTEPRLADYVYLLIDRYHSYGDLIVETLDDLQHIEQDDKDTVSYWLTNILVIGQLLDDVADWEGDLKVGIDNYLTLSIRKGDQNSSTTFQQKTVTLKIFDMCRYIQQHIRMIRKFEFNEPYMSHFSIEILNVFEHEIEAVISMYNELNTID